MLAGLFNVGWIKAGFRGDFLDQLLVVVFDAEPLGQLFSDAASAAAEFAADGDDSLHGVSLPLLCFDFAWDNALPTVII